MQFRYQLTSRVSVQEVSILNHHKTGYSQRLQNVCTLFDRHWLSALLLLGTCLVLFKHHGSSLLVLLGCVIAVSSSAALCLQNKDYPRLVLSLAISGIIIAAPGTHLIYGIWLVLLPKSRLFFPLTLFALSCHIADYASWGITPYTEGFSAITLILSTLAAWLPARLRAIGKLFLTVACLVLTAFEIVNTPESLPDTISDNKIPFGYRVGETVTRILTVNSSGPKTLRPVRSLLPGDIPCSSAGSVNLIEHDQWKPYPLIAAEGNWHQREPWNENQLLGNQFWLAAIFQDRQFQSNLGGQAIGLGRVLLASPSHEDGISCLAVERDNILYLADSDYFCNGMAGYQPALLKEIFGAHTQFTRFRILAILLLAIGICLEIRSFFSWSMVVAIGLVAGSFLCIPKPSSGDLRMVGNIFDPHETSHTSGTLGALNDGGICAIRGDLDAKMLVVAEGLSCSAQNEVVILLESAASVKIGREVVSANDVPLGGMDETVDARHLIINGKNIGRAECRVGGIRVIGTGSPAKNVVHLWPRP